MENEQTIRMNEEEERQMLKALIERQIEVKDNQIERLYEELKFYKNDMLDRYKEEVLRSVIKVRTSMKKEMERADWEERDAKRLRDDYRYVLEDLTDLLEMQDVEAFAAEPGSIFDGTTQMARVEETEDPTRHMTVKRSLSDGYKKGDRIMVMEKVLVYKAKK